MTLRPKFSAALVAAVVIITYLAWFLAPLLFIEPGLSRAPSTSFDLIYQASAGEVIIAIVLAALLSLMGWWKFIGFRASEKGGLKFVWPPFLFTLLLIAAAAWLAHSRDYPLLEVFDNHQLALLLSISFLVGFNEEIIFRGFLFQGLVSRFGGFSTIFLCGAIFGLFHLVNLLIGQPLDTTLSQVVQAGSMGFMYAAMRLRLGSIWPTILLHGFWDFSVSTLQQSVQLPGLESAPMGGFHPAMAIPVLLYGLFVYWRWSLWQRAQSDTP
jgi:membrane protease YdiL (CAAX protease family)